MVGDSSALAPGDSGPAAEEYSGSDPCSLANAVAVVGERWTFFLLREALAGVTRFSDFRVRLGIASDVLTNRLSKLVGAGILERREYREPGRRLRADYHLTEAGRQLGLAVMVIQQWGDVHTPSRTASSVAFTDPSGDPVRVVVVDEHDHEVPPTAVRFVRTGGAHGSLNAG